MTKSFNIEFLELIIFLFGAYILGGKFNLSLRSNPCFCAFSLYFIILFPLAKYVLTLDYLSGSSVIHKYLGSGGNARSDLTYYIFFVNFAILYFIFKPKASVSRITSKFVAIKPKYKIYNYLLVLTISYFALILYAYEKGGIENYLSNIELHRQQGHAGNGIFIILMTIVLFYFSITLVCSLADTKLFMLKLFLINLLTSIPSIFLGFRLFLIIPWVQTFLLSLKLRRAVSRTIMLSVFIFISCIYLFYPIVRAKMGNQNNTFFQTDSKIESVIRIDGPIVVSAIYLWSNSNQDYGYFLNMFYETLTILVPRNLWDGKPIPTSVRLCNNIFNVNGGVSPTCVGDSYYQGGWIGILIGSLICSIVCLAGDKIWIKSKLSSFNIILILQIFPFIIMMAEAISGALNSLLLGFVFSVICMKLEQFSVKIYRLLKL